MKVRPRYSDRKYDIPPQTAEAVASLAVMMAIMSELPRKSRARIISTLRSNGAYLAVGRVNPGPVMNEVRSQASEIVYFLSDTFAAAHLDKEANRDG